jgi:hypothetical protein
MPRSEGAAVVGQVFVEIQKHKDASHLPRAMRHRESPAVPSRVFGRGQHQPDPACVDERQLVEIQDNALAPLTQHGQTLCHQLARRDVELAAKPKTRPRALLRLNNFEGQCLTGQRALISPGRLRDRTRQRPDKAAVTSRGSEQRRSTNHPTPMPSRCKPVARYVRRERGATAFERASRPVVPKLPRAGQSRVPPASRRAAERRRCRCFPRAEASREARTALASANRARPARINRVQRRRQADTGGVGRSAVCSYHGIWETSVRPSRS